jgi:FAD/FMN-containing dehydrogenase
LNRIAVDAAGAAATIGAGARLIDVYNGLWNRRRTIPAGSCPTVGIAGLTLGGGVGFASRKLGLTCDNLLGATMVTASGRALACSARRNPDLFWALRGGGGGNFGIVTSFRFRVHPVSDATTFTITWPWERARAVVDAWQRWAPTAPDELFSVCGLRAQDAKGVPAQVSVAGQYLGATPNLAGLLGPLLAVPGAKLSARARTYIEAQHFWASCTGPASACRDRRTFAAKSDYANRRLGAAGIDVLVRAIEARQADPRLARGSVLLDSYGGAIARVPKAATAFVHRDALCSIQYQAVWQGSAAAAPNLAWLRQLYAAMRPHVSGFAYQNYIDPELQAWAVKYYGSNYPRLRRIKRAYDPGNLFRFAQSIRPA